MADRTTDYGDGVSVTEHNAEAAPQQQPQSQPQQQSGAAQTYREKYPQYAWAFDDPEVAYWLERAVREGMGPDELQGWIHKTAWWKQKTNAERDWLETFANNPAEANRQAWNYDSIVRYQKMAQDYGQAITFETAQKQVFRVVNGTTTPDALEEELRRWAKAMYPQLAQQFDAGATVAEIYAPYKQMAADLLGLNPDAISLSDPKWQSPLQYVGKDGTRRLATVDEWQTTIRTDARFGYDTSSRGKQEAAAFASQLGEMFGVL